jgi:CDP-glucose 4,6-dehydratase
VEFGQGAVEVLELIMPGDVQNGLAGKRVFLTGHTGFKGSWMSALLHRLGCEVHGFALPPVSEPSLYTLASVAELLKDETIGDIGDQRLLAEALDRARPDLVIHMAAQAFVRRGYADPACTWATNVQGTVNLLEAVRANTGVAGVIVVTTDKCYENRDWEWGYRETDALGGHDPYSASKAAAELVVQSYRRSFFAGGTTLLASARAGNVIGGGDWSEDRLLADAARSVAAGQPLLVRSPNATRPWQHVLDCLGGYLVLGAALLRGDAEAATALNFGPGATDNLAVGDVLNRLKRHWPQLVWELHPEAASAPHEANFLQLDSARARQMLQWKPRWSLDQALEKTAAWYHLVGTDPRRAMPMTAHQIEEYFA